MCISELLHWAKQQLLLSDTAALDAEVLLAYTLTLQRAQLFARTEQIVPENIVQTFKQLITRRIKGEPIAYIIGEQEFWSLSFYVTPDTLIPRADTECLIECVLAKLPQNKVYKIADLGTGCGAIALALAKERPHWIITATDKIPAALLVAQENALRLNIENVNFKQGDWCEALANDHFDVIASNPPYINTADKYWRDNINLFEPITALVSHDAGLADLQIIIQQAKQYLNPQGWLMLEHGYDQNNAVQQMLVQFGYKVIENKQDLAGIPRVTVAQIS